MRIALTACSLALAALTPAPAAAWGPHSEITRAAVERLPPSDRVEERLGILELQRYAWIPDYRDVVLPDYSPNDYLRFEGFPEHVSHLTPDVRRTYGPFFRRALQALRTESRANAARWTGSLLHFVQDSLSPPHALPTSGPLHSPMENWVDGDRVNVADYRPRQLARDVEAAICALEARMSEEIRVAREIGEQVRPLCERGDRGAAEPLILRAALSSARASADVLHTLLNLDRGRGSRTGGHLEVLVRAPKQPERPLAPVRMRLVGTPYSTFSEPITEATADYYRGRLLLRNLPPGAYEVELARSPLPPVRFPVTLRGGEVLRRSIDLSPQAAARS